MNDKMIKKMINETDESETSKVNWTNAWGEKYPVLNTYTQNVDIPRYADELRRLLEDLKDGYGYSDLDAMLVLKDILYHEWKEPGCNSR